jgi:alkanesulfonate monooxygenase SsuD/methylene tetrahydromethanopterin reductase-like flavin-dependent oxidoreductase (luciferase family)
MIIKYNLYFLNYRKTDGGVKLLKLGYKIAPEQFPPSELLQQVITAEKAGFESIDASDHFHPWSEDGQACFTWSWLGAAAVSTQSIELGNRPDLPDPAL